MFQNQHIVITGGSSGLGLELAHQLASEGARLTLIARNQSKLEDAKATPIKQHPNLSIPKASVEKIASDTLAEIRGKRFMIIPGFMTRAAAFSVQHFYGVSRWMGDRIITKAQKNK